MRLMPPWSGRTVCNIAGRAAEHRQRHEHGNQNGGNTDNRAGNLTHRLLVALGRQTFRRHNALDVFDDHNRIVDHDTDDQYHRKHGQYVNRHAHIGDKGKTAQQSEIGTTMVGISV